MKDKTRALERGAPAGSTSLALGRFVPAGRRQAARWGESLFPDTEAAGRRQRGFTDSGNLRPDFTPSVNRLSGCA
jgi:hypothetical protein